MQDQERSAVEKIVKLGVSDKIAQQILKPLAPDYRASDVDELYKVLQEKREEIDESVKNFKKLSYEEANQKAREVLTVSEKTMNKVLPKFDVDGSGDIDAQEFKGIMLYLSSKVITLAAKFESMDADGSGYLEYKEIEKITDEDQNFDIVLSDWIYENFFNTEGKISKTEFLDMWSKLLRKFEISRNEICAIQKILGLGVDERIARQILKPLHPDYRNSDVDQLYKSLNEKREEIDESIRNFKKLSYEEANQKAREVLTVSEKTMNKVLPKFDVDGSGDIDAQEFKGIMLYLSSRVITLAAKFESMDADGSGYLEYKEIEKITDEDEDMDEVLTDWIYENFFDVDGKISKTEFLDMWNQLLREKEISKKESLAVKKILDLGVSERIARQILKPLHPDYRDADVDQLYKSLNEKRKEIDESIKNFKTLNYEEASKKAREAVLNVTEETMNKILPRFDVDGSGDIDSQEFKGIMLYLSSRIITLAAKFEMMDADGSGYLEYSEIEKLNEELGDSTDDVLVEWLFDNMFEEEKKMSKTEFLDKWNQLLVKKERK